MRQSPFARKSRNRSVVRLPAARRQAALLPRRSVGQLWLLSVGLSVLVAAADALLGERVVLIGLLVIGPCCALLTGRLLQTTVTSLFAIGLAIVLGYPDNVWGAGSHLMFIAAVGVVSLVAIVAAAIIDLFRDPTWL